MKKLEMVPNSSFHTFETPPLDSSDAAFTELVFVSTTIIETNQTQTGFWFISWQNALAFFGLFLFAAPSAVLNLFIAVIILATRAFRNEPTYLAMLVLALTDIGHCYVAIFPMGASILTGTYFPSEQQRFVYLNVIYVFWYTTCIAYGTIALNRFLMMCWPKLNDILFTRTRMLIWIGCWPVLVALCMLPILTGGCCGFDFSPKLWLLRYEDGHDHKFNVQLVICYVASASTTAVSLFCYVAIILKMRSVRSHVTAKTKEWRRLQKTDAKLTAQFFILTAVFTFTWITIHYEASRGPELSNQAVNYAGLIGYAAMSAMNPFVYFTMNKCLLAAAADLVLALIQIGRRTASIGKGSRSKSWSSEYEWHLLTPASREQAYARRMSCPARLP